MSDTILDVRNLTVEFPSEGKITTAVDRISLKLEQGQILGIVGESGSGKSVTSLAIMGLIPNPGMISGGEIWFRPAKGNSTEPVNLVAMRSDKLRNYRGGEIAMIFQEPMSSLNPVYNIGFQIIEAIRLHQKVTLEQAKNQAIDLLQEVRLLPSDEELEQKYKKRHNHQNNEKSPLPEQQIRNSQRKQKESLPLTQQIKNYQREQKESLLKRYPHELSGGQLQRVMIAMAISCDPTILIADEPTTALDVTVQKEILKLLRDLCKLRRDMSMIFISHDLGVINEVADIVAVMLEGKVVEKGSKEQVLKRPKHPYTKGLLACRPRLNIQPEELPTVDDFLEKKRDKQRNIIELIEKEPPQFKFISLQEERQRWNQISQQENLLVVKDLSVKFPIKGVFGQTKQFFNAVDNISFDVKQGETLGLVGESGCGKSTLAKAILRLITATNGDVFFLEKNIAHLPIGSSRLRSIRKHMQIVFQNPYNSLNPRLTIGNAIMEPMIIHNTNGNEPKRKERVAELLDQVQLDPNWFNRYPHQLSGGQRQRVCIARALALNPQFIICDESVSALDVSVQAEVLNLLKELQKLQQKKGLNLTYIFISHDLSVVRYMSDRIIVMNKGKIEEMGTPEEIINYPKSDYTQKLINSIPKFDDETFN